MLETFHQYWLELIYIAGVVTLFEFHKDGMDIHFHSLFLPLAVAVFVLRQWGIAKPGRQIVLRLAELPLIAISVALFFVKIREAIPLSEQFVINSILSLCILVMGRPEVWTRKKNRTSRHFLGLMLNMLLSFAVAMAISIGAWMLFNAVWLGIEMLFLDNSPLSVENLFWDIQDYINTLILCLVTPWAYLDAERRNRKDPKLEGFLSKMINYFPKVGVVIYTAILYTYGLMILIRWELPNGMVATLVISYAVVAMGVWLFNQYQERPILNRFTRNIGWYVLPTLVLFWIGVSRRISDYGLTEDRYLLLVGGILMTLFVLLSLPPLRRSGKASRIDFYFFSLVTLTVFIHSVIPALSPERISFNSQVHRVKTYAETAGMLTPEGKIDLNHTPSLSDTLYAEEHKKIMASLQCLDKIDTIRMQQSLGISRAIQYNKLLLDEVHQYMADQNDRESIFWISGSIREPLTIEGYRYFIDGTNEQINVSRKGIVTIKFQDATYRFDTKEHLWERIKELGMTDENPSKAWIEEHQDQLMVYKTEDFMIAFTLIGIYNAESYYRITNRPSVDFVLIK